LRHFTAGVDVGGTSPSLFEGFTILMQQSLTEVRS
jgi:hypothetical protein